MNRFFLREQDRLLRRKRAISFMKIGTKGCPVCASKKEKLKQLKDNDNKNPNKL